MTVEAAVRVWQERRKAWAGKHERTPNVTATAKRQLYSAPHVTGATQAIFPQDPLACIGRQEADQTYVNGSAGLLLSQLLQWQIP